MNVQIHDFLPQSETVLWDLWYPEAGATGVPFARGRLNPTEVLWVHAAPPHAGGDGPCWQWPGHRAGRELDTLGAALSDDTPVSRRSKHTARGSLARGGGPRQPQDLPGRRRRYPARIVECCRVQRVAVENRVL